MRKPTYVGHTLEAEMPATLGEGAAEVATRDVVSVLLAVLDDAGLTDRNTCIDGAVAGPETLRFPPPMPGCCKVY